MDDTISWVADEYKRHDHDTGWYAGLFMTGIILVAWGLYSNNVIATILFVLIVFAIYALSHREPEKIMVQIGTKGIALNEVFYPYSQLKSFWVVMDGEHTRLEFETKSLLHKHLAIELEDQDPDMIRDYLGHFVEEIEDREENLVDVLMRKLKI